MLALITGAAWWVKLIAVIAIVAALVYGWHVFTESYREEGRAEIRIEWEAAKAAAIKASNEQEQKWLAERDAREQAEKERDDERAKRTAMAADAARRLSPAVSRVVVPAPAVAVLRDAVAGSNTAASPTVARKPVEAAPAAAADSDVGTITRWGVEVIAVCTEYRDRALGLIAFYNALRDAQPAP